MEDAGIYFSSKNLAVNYDRLDDSHKAKIEDLAAKLNVFFSV